MKDLMGTALLKLGSGTRLKGARAFVSAASATWTPSMMENHEARAPFNCEPEPSLSRGVQMRYIYLESRRQRPARGAWRSQPSSPSTSFERAVDEKGK